MRVGWPQAAPRGEADAQLSAPDTAAVAHGNRSSNRSGRAEDGGWWMKRPVAPARRREQVHAVENRWLGERGDVESSKLEDWRRRGGGGGELSNL